MDRILHDISSLGYISFDGNADFSTEFSGLANCIADTRNYVLDFIKDNASSYQDDWKLVFNLMGITVGLIAANTKGLPRNLRLISYIYAAAHLKSYHNSFGEFSQEKASRLPSFSLTLEDSHLSENQSLDNLQGLLEACNSFQLDQHYIGVFGVLSDADSAYVKYLARIDWAAIIDFDSSTDKAGHLLNNVREQMNLRKYVHLMVPGNDTSHLNSERACYWFAARGLTNDQSSTSTNLDWRTWNRKQSIYLEKFSNQLSVETTKPVTIIIFWNDADFIEDIARIAERFFFERVSFVVINEDSASLKNAISKYEMKGFSVSSMSFMELVRDKFPANLNIDSEIIIPAFNGTNNQIEYRVIPTDIFNSLEEECEIIHLNLGITQDVTVEEQPPFLRGAKINWFELNLHTDVERDLVRHIERQADVDLSARSITRIWLFHHPGAGGSTIAFRVLWNLHWNYPSIVLKSISSKTIERVKDVYTRSQQSILILIDSSQIDANQINTLYDQLRANQTPSVLLIVHREFQLPYQSERTFPLYQNLDNREAWRFATVLSKEVPDRASDLEKLAKGSANQDRRTPFLFGLTAFEEDFKGIDTFVKVRLHDIPDTERKILSLISIAYYFGQQDLDAQIFASLVGLPTSRTVNLRKYLQPARQDLLISDLHGWRPLHFLIAEEILVQLLAGSKEREQWTEMLSQYAVEIVQLLSDAAVHLSSDLNKAVVDLLSNLFVERGTQDFYADGRNKFSLYIEKTPTIEGKRLIFNTLVEYFPDEPHFWGHKARLLWQYAREEIDYEEALESVNQALKISLDDRDYALYHIKGLVLAKWSTYLMNRSRQDFDVNGVVDTESLDRIQKLFEEALIAFKYIREELKPTEERAYISAVAILTRYIEFNKSISNYKTFADFFNAPKSRIYWEYLAEAENLLRQVRRIRTGESRESIFVQERVNYLNRVYDNHSLFINGLWNLLDKAGIYQPSYRRNIVYAYLARRDRDWDNLEGLELERAKDLMEQNLLAEPGNNHNMRLWFEAVRRIPSTSLNSAIEQLTYWINQANTIDILDATYYLFVLHAISAIEGSEIAALSAQKYIQKGKELSQDRTNRTYSFDWLGKGRGPSRLIPRSRLGRFDEETRFFTDTSLLERITGRIDKIASRQSGIIKAYGLSFFFTPSPGFGHQFIPGRNENDSVTFFIGFSYDGPRAWDVRPL